MRSILFVCLGNICRSPSAEGVFKDIVERAGQSAAFHIDSCGTGGGSGNWYKPNGFSFHTGDKADERMRAAAKGRGITLTSRSRPLVADDLRRFDRIIAMDASNVHDIKEAARFWGPEFAKLADEKVSLMTSYCTGKYEGSREVPDPYYGGPAGFEHVLDLLDNACEQLLVEERGFVSKK